VGGHDRSFRAKRKERLQPFPLGLVGAEEYGDVHPGYRPPVKSGDGAFVGCTSAHDRLSFPYCSGVRCRYIPPLPTSIAYSSVCRASEVPPASPRLASSRIFSGSAKVSFLGSGVFRSGSRNWTANRTAGRSTCRLGGSTFVAGHVGILRERKAKRIHRQSGGARQRSRKPDGPSYHLLKVGSEHMMSSILQMRCSTARQSGEPACSCKRSRTSFASVLWKFS
jgi:hypothetical protein